MSHAAVNWALEQKGLKPAAKLVLICLADRHNKDSGECFPSQERLASDACLSRSSLNDQLNMLEGMGYFTREVLFNARTRKRENCRYHLNIGFTPDPAAALSEPQAVSEIRTRKNAGAMSEIELIPCPNLAEIHVRNSDNNPVRGTSNRTVRARPSIFSQGFWVALLHSLGLDPDDPPDRWRGEQAWRDVEAWRLAGLSEAQILERAAASRQQRADLPMGPKALDARMRDAVATVAPIAEKLPRERVLALFADHINGEARFAPSAISEATARDLVKLRLVTAARLRERGIRL